MRYRLRTLLIVLAILPPLLWGGFAWWERYQAWRESQLKQAQWNVRVFTMPPGQKSPLVFPPESDYQGPPEER